MTRYESVDIYVNVDNDDQTINLLDSHPVDSLLLETIEKACNDQDIPFDIDTLNITFDVNGTEIECTLDQAIEISELHCDNDIFFAAMDEYGDGSQMESTLSCLRDNDFIYFSDADALVDDFCELMEVPDRLRPYLDEEMIVNNLLMDRYSETRNGGYIRFN